MKKINIEATNGKITDIQGNIDNKRKEQEELEQKKLEVMDAHNQVDGANLDERVRNNLFDDLASERQKISETAETKAKELDSDAAMLEELALEVDESKSDSEAAKGKLENMKSGFEKFGMGAALEDGISELEDNISNLDEVRANISKASRDLRDVQTKLTNLHV